MANEDQRGATLQTVLLTLLAGAFMAWAGVVLWAADVISARLSDIERGLESVKVEMAAFKLNLSERITRAESQAERVVDLEQEIRRIDVYGARAPNPETRDKVDRLEQRVDQLEKVEKH
jgi:cell division protein FtsB